MATKRDRLRGPYFDLRACWRWLRRTLGESWMSLKATGESFSSDAELEEGGGGVKSFEIVWRFVGFHVTKEGAKIFGLV